MCLDSVQRPVVIKHPNLLGHLSSEVFQRRSLKFLQLGEEIEVSWAQIRTIK